MVRGLELDFDKYCVVDGSPKTVLLSPCHSKVEKRKARKKPKCGYEVLLSQDKEFMEISLCHYRSASCGAVQSTSLGVNEGQKRGSVYQSSNEIGKMNRIGEKETKGRKKIEFSPNAVPNPFEIIDSLCSSDDDEGLLGLLSSSFLDMSLNSINKENVSTRREVRQSASIPLNKSLSARLMLPHSPTKSESDLSKATSPKTRFSPFKKMFDPFTKSDSRPLGSVSEEPDEVTSSGPVSVSRDITLRKSLMHDFSNTKGDSNSFKKDSCSSTVSSSSSSPAHLNGVLKLGNKSWMPYFEFSVKNPNDVLVAKKLKLEDGCNWVYTFHTAQNIRKINASGRRFKDHSNKRSTMVGQMQVSCYLCTEVVNAGAFDNSMLTEFVLYDLSRPRQSVSRVTDHEKGDVHQKVVAALYPDLETAAIVIQFPSEKRESLKCKEDDMQNDDLLNLSRIMLEKNKRASDCITPAKVSVVIPSGNHGLPSGESRGTSPLLDRWRLGGGCDCGGWDMGCPLVVFSNPNIQKDETCKQPVELFVKGSKEKTPALTMKMAEEGQYAVDFHARLSSLQAFSICVAVLHSTKESISVSHDEDREMLQCDSLRVFAEDEVKHLIEVVPEEEKRRPGKNDIPPSFVVNPPFSPMSRA